MKNSACIELLFAQYKVVKFCVLYTEITNFILVLHKRTQFQPQAFLVRRMLIAVCGVRCRGIPTFIKFTGLQSKHDQPPMQKVLEKILHYKHGPQQHNNDLRHQGPHDIVCIWPYVSLVVQSSNLNASIERLYVSHAASMSKHALIVVSTCRVHSGIAERP